MLTYRIDVERRLVLATCVGRITTAQVMSYQDALRADPTFDPTFSLVFDGSAGGFAGIGALQMRRVVENAPFAPTALRALVASGGLTFGLFRMFRTFSELTGRGDTLEVFRDLDVARAWIEGQQRFRA